MTHTRGPWRQERGFDSQFIYGGPEDQMDDEWESGEDDIPEDQYGDFDEGWPAGPKIILGG